jgi:uroporphyrinogen III methyltransferase/synthase
MTVYLVGAGPGDPGLLTRRGAELLARAELVVHDRLSAPGLLDLCPPGVERVDVGKRPGGPADQDGINALLVEAGRAGRLVVRLKGGDPFVFGRGAEEALALQAAGVAYEVVPGVTSAIAAPAYAGVPVTHRGVSTSFSVVTGHSRAAIDEDVNWEALAQVGGTVVVLMGVAHRAEIAARLMAGGRDPATPVAAVRWGTRPDQRLTQTTLGELGAVVLEPPVTLVIGEVAALGLDWYERGRPLLGRRVVVTRSAAAASAVSSRLAEAGAEVVEVPTIELAPPADGGAALRAAAGQVGTYDWVVFTSPNAVDRFMALLRDARQLGSAQVAAIGPGTADALLAWRVVADLVPARSVSEGLVEVFPHAPKCGRVLLPRAAVARKVLPEGLRAMGWRCDVVEAYVTRRARVAPEVMSSASGADAITFASASSVQAWLELGAKTPGLVVCIGPVTAAAAEEGGLRVRAIASPHSIEGLVAATIHHLSTGR